MPKTLVHDDDPLSPTIGALRSHSQQEKRRRGEEGGEEERGRKGGERERERREEEREGEEERCRKDTATKEIYTIARNDAITISAAGKVCQNISI